MFATAPAIDPQASSEHAAASGNRPDRRPLRRCNCLRCNQANGSKYLDCTAHDPEPTLPKEPFDEVLDLSDANLTKADTLTKEQKSRVWRYIQQHDPNMVAFLQDPTVAALIRKGATPLFPNDLVQRALGSS